MNPCDQLNKPKLKYRVEHHSTGMIYEADSLAKIGERLAAGAIATGRTVKDWAQTTQYISSRIHGKEIEVDYTSDESILESTVLSMARAGFLTILHPQIPFEMQ